MLGSRTWIPVAVVVSTSLCACASVQDGENEAAAQESVVSADDAAPSGPHRGPPPEAIEACESLTDGADCTVELPALEIGGTCLAAPAGEGPLACVPAGGPPPPHGGPGAGPGPHPGAGGPPPEAIAACNGKTEADGCAVKLPERSIEGTCRRGPNGETPLACVPKNLPPPPPPPPGAGPPGGGPGGHGGPPPEAIAACESLPASAACSIRLPAREIAGTCRSGPGGQGALVCVPKDMPPPPPPPPLPPPTDDN
jgi:hypothetical protein